MGALLRASGSFLVRMPVRAADDDNPAALASVPPPAAGREAYRELLRVYAEDALLVEAVDIATPTLSRVWDQAAAGIDDGLSDAQLRRAALAVLRYRLRMSSRPTPFGLFAGVSGGEFGGTPGLSRGPADQTRTLMDMDWLLGIVRTLERDPDVLRLLRVQRHQDVTIRGDRATAESQASVSMRATPVLREALRLSEVPVRAAELAMLLHGHADDAPDDRILGLLRLLVSENFLLTELRPPLDGTDPLRHVLAALDGAGPLPAGPDRLRHELRAVDLIRLDYDAAPPGAGRALLGQLRRRASAIREHANPVQVDTRVDADVLLPTAVRVEVERMADVLWRLSPAAPGSRSLRAYHGRFIERYGVDRLVPLQVLLDENRGLGTPYGYRSTGVGAPVPDPDDRREVLRSIALSRLVASAVRGRCREVELDEATLADLTPCPAAPEHVQDSCELYVHVAAASPDDLAAGEFLVVLATGRGSHRAGATFGRFADMLPRGYEPASAADDGTDGMMVADLAFAPRSAQAANLVNAPPLARWRITVGLPGSALAEEIAISDIAIGGSQERLYAVHVPTGRQIVPALPSMVNATTQAPDVCRLLHEIGMEGQRHWEPLQWGSLRGFPFLPRIRYGRAVLSSAIWRLDDLRGHQDDFAAAVDRWRRDWDVPRRVMVGRNDQWITLDLADPWQREILRDELRKDHPLLAQEIPGGFDEWKGHGVAGQAVEIAVPLARHPAAPRPMPSAGFTDTARRDGLLGGGQGDWLSLTVYCSRRTQDAFLRDNVPLMVQAGNSAGIQRWFFVRYRDRDGDHLRLRFNGPAEELFSAFYPKLSGMLAEWQNNGLIGSYQVRQYDPELERYGGSPSRAAAELVFQRDSAAAVALLRMARTAGFPYSLDTLTAVSVSAMAYAAADKGDDGRWPGPAVDRRYLPAEYRRRMDWWRRILDPAGDWPALSADKDGARVLAALRDRDDAVRAFTASVRAGGLVPAEGAVGSLLHITCNRLIGVAPERESLVMGIARGAGQDNARRRRHLTRHSG
jgi:thiopeptide-type bacteriocin biosynthesis protein